jgi:hypothetical protein
VNKGKHAKWQYAPQNEKRTKTVENPQSFYSLHPTWSFSKCDFDHERWSMPCHEECLINLMKKLKSYEGQSWSEILSDTSGRRNNTKNHPIPVTSLIHAAQKRLEQINLDDFDELYSLTIDGSERLWGVMTEGVFCIVWLDTEHEVCPSTKRFT